MNDAKRAFLERSLADLDDELAAGDLSPDDHARLRADYERRLSALDQPRPPSRSRRPGPKPAAARTSRPVVAVALVALLAVVSGVLLAQTVGRRGAGDNISGIDLSPDDDAAPATTGTTLATALQECITASGSEAVACFIEYTRVNPDDARGFLHFGEFSISQGLELDNDDLLSGGESFLRRALEIDPTLVEARVDLAVFLERRGRDDDARAMLAPLEGQELPPDLADLVAFVEQNLANG